MKEKEEKCRDIIKTNKDRVQRYHGRKLHRHSGDRDIHGLNPVLFAKWHYRTYKQAKINIIGIDLSRKVTVSPCSVKSQSFGGRLV